MSLPKSVDAKSPRVQKVESSEEHQHRRYSDDAAVMLSAPKDKTNSPDADKSACSIPADGKRSGTLPVPQVSSTAN